MKEQRSLAPYLYKYPRMPLANYRFNITCLPTHIDSSEYSSWCGSGRAKQTCLYSLSIKRMKRERIETLFFSPEPLNYVDEDEAHLLLWIITNNK